MPLDCPMTRESDARTTRQNSLGYIIQRLSGWLDEQMAAELKPLGLSHAQFAVLMTVLEQEGQSQAEIGQKFHMPPYAISRAIDALEQQGNVVRRVNPQMRQAHGIHATDKAHTLAPQLFAIVQNLNARLLAPLSPAEQDSFAVLLNRVHHGH